MIRVLIADDHALVRRGIRQLLEPLPGVLVVGDVASGKEVTTAVETMRPDVLLLDVSMPGPTFLDLLETLAVKEPRLRTLVVSVHAEAVYARRAIRAGAAGYITKGHTDKELIEAVRAVAAGTRYVSPEFTQELAADAAFGRPGMPHQALTNREQEIMLLLARGHTVTQIATQLGLSVKTVSTHRTRLLRKMEMTSNAELVRYALAHSLID